VRHGSGRCEWKCAIGVQGPRRVTGVLACGSRSATMTVGVEEGGQGQVNYLLIRPGLAP
jgi:hypothetical protein